MNQITPAQLLEKLNSPEGKKLLSIMKKDGGAAFMKAADAAKNGNYSEAQAALAPLLEGTQAEELSKKLMSELG